MSDAPHAAVRARQEWALYLGILASVALLDQAVKLLVFTACTPEFRKVVIPGLFTLVNWQNTGAAWGMFRGHTEVLAVVSATVLVLMTLFRRYLADGSRRALVALALIAGGILGNLLDRVCHGAVIDYLFFHVGAYGWPAFNLADSAITVGVGAYLLSAFRRARPPPPSRVT